MKKIFIILFLMNWIFSYEIITKFSTNDIDIFQLQGEINDSGDISENLEYIIHVAPSNYNFFFEDGDITGGEEDDLWKHITNHTRLPKIIMIETNVAANTTTTSNSYIIMLGMTNLPASGTYLVMFSASGTGDTAGSWLDYALFKAGSIVTHTERFNEGNEITDMHTQAILTFNGSEAIEVRYEIDTGAAVVEARSLILLKLSD